MTAARDEGKMQSAIPLVYGLLSHPSTAEIVVCMMTRRSALADGLDGRASYACWAGMMTDTGRPTLDSHIDTRMPSMWICRCVNSSKYGDTYVQR